jgi:acetoacetyl-CoA reductase/3-oxoacyl-[acyl-carrier protein] reductase
MTKLVMITGGSRGIGKALVRTFAEAGYATAFTFREQAGLADALCQTLPPTVFATAMDQEDPTSITTAVDTIENHFGRSIDVLVNNAAMAQEKPFEEISADDWARMMSVNLAGPFLLAQRAVTNMQKKKWGRIINISSIGGQWGGVNQVHYAASKAGLISLTHSLARLYSSAQITANAIAIGLVATDMTQQELSTTAGKAKVKTIPSGRLGTAEEITKMALFLASDDAAYLTGQTLNANGGMYFG